MRPISIDTRTLQAGDIFIPIQGENFDGRDFIGDAISKGASILDVKLQSYAKSYRKKLNCPVLAITGSAGKTTLKDMLTAILGQTLNVVSTYENQNNEIGAPLTLIRADDRTDLVIAECGMRQKGDLKYLAKILAPTHVLITHIGLTHREFFKSQRGIALGKAEILQSAPKWQTGTRTAFLPYTSDYKDLLIQTAQKKHFNILPIATQEIDGIEQNIATCFTVGRHFGLSDDIIRKGIEVFKTSSNRLKKIVHLGITIMNDAYNNNPSGLRFALSVLRQMPGRKIAVIGDMLELGEVSDDEHQKIPYLCVELGIDVCIGYGSLMAKIQSDVHPYTHFKDKETLQSFLNAELRQGDYVLIKGSRGLQMETIVQGITES